VCCNVCSDTICDLGGTNELANYGEYSGAPSEQQTYEYAKTVLGLMTKEVHPDGQSTAQFINLRSPTFNRISYFKYYKFSVNYQTFAYLCKLVLLF